MKDFLVKKTILQSFSTDEDESEDIIFNAFSTEDDESKLKIIIVNKCSTEEYKSECVINKQTDAKNEVTYDVPSYFKVLECGRKLLKILDASYEQACVATPVD